MTTPNYGLDPSAPQPDPTAHLVDRYYISQFDTSTVGIQINIAGVPGDPDGNSVVITEYDINDDLVLTQDAVRVGVGLYQITFTSEQTATPGYFTLNWSFSISSVPQVIQTYIQVGATNPAYDALPPEMKAIVEQTWTRFSDMFDSPQGGPHFQTYFQTAFSRGRLAQLLQLALNKINATAQPYMTYGLSGGTEFPYAQWGPLLEQGLYIETLKHFIRSYIEQPSPQGITVSRNDRRDYMDRWEAMLQIEQKDYKDSLDVFKITNMFLARPRVLVSGGAFGNWGPTRLPGSAAARGINRIWAAFY